MYDLVAQQLRSKVALRLAASAPARGDWSAIALDPVCVRPSASSRIDARIAAYAPAEATFPRRGPIPPIVRHTF